MYIIKQTDAIYTYCCAGKREFLLQILVHHDNGVIVQRITDDQTALQMNIVNSSKSHVRKIKNTLLQGV